MKVGLVVTGKAGSILQICRMLCHYPMGFGNLSETHKTSESAAKRLGVARRSVAGAIIDAGGRPSKTSTRVEVSNRALAESTRQGA